MQDSLIRAETSVLDYGCGQGDDVRQLQAQGIACVGWDPFFAPDAPRAAAEVVNLGYVVNVIENPIERSDTLRTAWSLATKLLIASARLTLDAESEVQTPYRDGYVTRRSTFQKLFEQHELKTWIDSTLHESSIAAAPGVFYVFRDPDLQYAYLTTRLRGRVHPRLQRSRALFDLHRPLYDELIAFVQVRGRLPAEDELPSSAAICEQAGSIRRAFTIVRRATGPDLWEQVRTERAQDLLVYLALARFSRRPRFSALPRSLQLDLRAFFATYRRACKLGDELLFSAGNRETIEQACRASSIGKLTPTALYVHETALACLDPVLRVYEGCAQALTGHVEAANVVKLHFDEPMVSYLSYPTFDTDAHPALATSLCVHLQTFKLRYRKYVDVLNPPILHRKEQFVRKDDPRREKYESLTRQEEAKGLYDQPSQIGMREGWQRFLDAKGLRIRGHRLLRTSSV